MPPYFKILDDSCHYQQASTDSTQGLGKSDTTGILHIQRSNHRVPGMSLCQF